MVPENNQEALFRKLKGLPANPGCYLFKDAADQILYVGKATSLRARVRSYFQSGSSDQRAFLPWMRREVTDVVTWVTASEKEATILESALIKEHRPRFNVKLRDDKEYLSLKLDTTRDWPRLELVRKQNRDGARYFGPYHSATAARRTLQLVEKSFQLRTCPDREFRSRKRPCLQYQIRRCLAPCVRDVDEEQYAVQARAVSLFLDGGRQQLSKELKARMLTASGSLDFELAARYRDQLSAVESVWQQQRVVSVSNRDQDVLGVYRDGNHVELTLMAVRAGRVVDFSPFSHARTEVPTDEVVATFVREYYGWGARVPDEVLLPVLPAGADGVAEWLSELRAGQAADGAATTRRTTGRCRLGVPQRGVKRDLLALAEENALHNFKENRREAQSAEHTLGKIQKTLRLATLPRRIECCDISHLGGLDTVGVVVSMLAGKPDKSRYRTYHIKSVTGGDDYGAMYEVLARRFRRGVTAKSDEPTAVDDGDQAASAWELPELFVVDGGRGQLSVALAAMHDLGLHDLALVGLAKERESVSGEAWVDRVYLPGQKNPIPLDSRTPELLWLARARDEAHRFSNVGRRRLGKARRLTSKLDHIPGVGPKLRTALLTRFGTIEGVCRASDAELLSVPRITRQLIAELRAGLKTDAPSG